MLHLLRMLTHILVLQGWIILTNALTLARIPHSHLRTSFYHHIICLVTQFLGVAADKWWGDYETYKYAQNEKNIAPALS